jgi:hypothetical protein
MDSLYEDGAYRVYLDPAGRITIEPKAVNRWLLWAAMPALIAVVTLGGILLVSGYTLVWTAVGASLTLLWLVAVVVTQVRGDHLPVVFDVGAGTLLLRRRRYPISRVRLCPPLNEGVGVSLSIATDDGQHRVLFVTAQRQRELEDLAGRIARQLSPSSEAPPERPRLRARRAVVSLEAALFLGIGVAGTGVCLLFAPHVNIVGPAPLWPLGVVIALVGLAELFGLRVIRPLTEERRFFRRAAVALVLAAVYFAIVLATWALS